MSKLIFKLYGAGSIGAMRCEKIANAILSDIKGMPVDFHAPRVCKSYTMYNDADGWMDVTIYTKKHNSRLYSIMRRDNKRHKVSVLEVRINDDGRHFASTHTWDV